MLVASHKTVPNWKEQRGLLCPGDTLLLATDALAKCLFQSAESGSFAGGELIDLQADEFGFWVAAARATGSLRNDDVALGVIEVV